MQKLGCRSLTWMTYESDVWSSLLDVSMPPPGCWTPHDDEDDGSALGGCDAPGSCGATASVGDVALLLLPETRSCWLFALPLFTANDTSGVRILWDQKKNVEQSYTLFGRNLHRKLW